MLTAFNLKKKSKMSRPLGRLTYTKDNNIKMDVKQCDNVECIHLFLNRFNVRLL